MKIPEWFSFSLANFLLKKREKDCVELYGQKMDTCMYEDIFKAARNLMLIFEKIFELNFLGGYRIFLVFLAKLDHHNINGR